MKHTAVPNSADEWRIGQLADATGITVRALHHYDHTGLLSPSRQSSSGHRVYGSDDVARLYRILALRQLGFGLAEIKAFLDEAQWDLREMVVRHAQKHDAAITAATKLSHTLRNILGRIDDSDPVDPEQFFIVIEEMTMMESPIKTTISMLIYDDLDAAYAYLRDVLGLTASTIEHGADGSARFAELFAGDHAIWLHPTGEGYRSPATLGAASNLTVIAVDSVDDIYSRASSEGAEIVQEPVDQDYGVREFGVRDLEGHLWFFHQSLG